jgi:hypothetical protein
MGISPDAGCPDPGGSLLGSGGSASDEGWGSGVDSGDGSGDGVGSLPAEPASTSSKSSPLLPHAAHSASTTPIGAAPLA